ncbi:uncharacterized protein LOC143547612 [Bidens hawaiensis]|uniref:uncharacterized protein LOC143547612 n=1 Tax=Bidens hawaiensis TaxID=980011 RepID=UPI00404B8C35
MSHAIDFSTTHRILLLIDLNPLLQSPNPNPNYINSILTTSKLILSFNPLQDSLFTFKFIFNSQNPHPNFTSTLTHHFNSQNPDPNFNSPLQTLDSLTNALNSIPFTQLTSLPTNCSHLAENLVHLVQGFDWETRIDDAAGNSGFRVRSNLVILLSPVCKSVKLLGEFTCVDVNENCTDLDGCLARFRDCFGAVSEALNGMDIHFCWIDVCDRDEEFKETIDVIGNEIRKFGWGFCSVDSVVLGSALVSFGLVYPNIVVSSKLPESCGLDDKIRGQLSLEILDVSGKPLECKFCDLELQHLKQVGSSEAQRLGLNDGVMKLHVTAVQKYTEYASYEEFLSESFVVRSVESGKKGKDGLDNLVADRVLELLAGESCELFGKKTVPTWQIFLSFLYREGYWALLSLSSSNGDSYTGILKPFTVHSAVLLVLDNKFNNHSFIQKSGGTKLLMNDKFSQCDTDFQKGASSSGKDAHVGDGKRRKMKKQAYLDLTWSSFCKAAYEFTDVDLAEVYFASGLKKSKKLKFLKCWMKEVKKWILSLDNVPRGSCEKGSDSSQQKEKNINDELLSMRICSDQSRTQDAAVLVSCSETVESFFGNLPMKIQHGLESDVVDLKTLAERLVNSFIYWLRIKHESCTVQVAEIMKLLLREPKDLTEHKDDNPDSTSKYLFIFVCSNLFLNNIMRYELQILLRLEILQSEYAGSIKGSLKMKLVKQICFLLEIIQYLVEGGLHGDVSLYDYVEGTIKARYSENLGDVVDKIYDQMDLLPFGEETEDQAFMFNSEDSNQSWRDKHERNDTSASKVVQDSLSVEDESCHPLDKVNTTNECETQDDHAQKLNEARERRERARRLVVSTSRMPDLQRVWAPKQLKPVKVKHEPRSKKHRKVSYSVVCETPLIDNKPSCSTQQKKGERSNPVSKALFQDNK